MRKVCPNFENVDGLETVLDVPIPEDMWRSIGNTGANRWQNLCALMKPRTAGDGSSSPATTPSASSSSSSNSTRLSASSNNEFISLLKLVGCPLVPLQVQSDHTLSRPLKDSSIVSFQCIHFSIF